MSGSPFDPGVRADAGLSAESPDSILKHEGVDSV